MTWSDGPLVVALLRHDYPLILSLALARLDQIAAFGDSERPDAPLEAMRRDLPSTATERATDNRRYNSKKSDRYYAFAG